VSEMQFQAVAAAGRPVCGCNYRVHTIFASYGEFNRLTQEAIYPASESGVIVFPRAYEGPKAAAAGIALSYCRRVSTKAASTSL